VAILEPLEGQLSLQINSWLGSISFDRAFTTTITTTTTTKQNVDPREHLLSRVKSYVGNKICFGRTWWHPWTPVPVSSVILTDDITPINTDAIRTRVRAAYDFIITAFVSRSPPLVTATRFHFQIFQSLLKRIFTNIDIAGIFTWCFDLCIGEKEMS
jgi:hypothetical protein